MIGFFKWIVFIHRFSFGVRKVPAKAEPIRTQTASFRSKLQTGSQKQERVKTAALRLGS
jgi:hypothetical protein